MGLLRDFAQGASNSVASGVSAPVDGLAWLLRKAGMPVPAAPVGGSDWMAQKGLTAEPKNKLAGLLGESAGGVVPMLTGAYAPKIANGMLNLDAHAMDMARRGIENRMVSGGLLQPATVWHGSKDPRWIDRGEEFSASVPAANMKSKFLWVNPKKEVAESYAGTSELQKWKAANGMGATPGAYAGVRRLDLDDGAKILKVNDIKKASKKIGIEWGGPDPLEKFLDAAKSSGYDAVQMQIDGGNIAVLNPAVIKRNKPLP